MKKLFIFAAVAMLLASCSLTSSEVPTSTDTTAVDSVTMAAELSKVDSTDTNVVVLDDVVYHLDSTKATK